MPELGAVVLASGESARFGDSDKLLAPFHGKPLLAHALMALPGDVFIRWLVVTRGAEAAALAKSLGFDVLLHDKPDVSDTIRLGIARMRGLDGCLFCVGDQPLLRADTVRRLAAAFAAEPARIVRAAFDGRGGNPVLFPQALFGELAALAAGQSGGAVIRAHRELVLPVQAQYALELEDVDTRTDLKRLAQFSSFEKERD